MQNEKTTSDAARQLGEMGASKGGIARANALSKEERRDIARKAAEARWGDSESTLPRADFTGDIEVGNTTIPCAVLELPGEDDPVRLLTQEGFLKAIGRAGKAKGGQGASVDAFPAFLAAQNLKPYIPKDLVGSTLLKPIIFRTTKSRKAYGYRAELLAMVCETYIDANRKGVFDKVPAQKKIAEQAEILHRGLARVAIIALIDEATGYQEVRNRFALQKILDRYLTDEWSKWTKRFPESFYKELFRLRGVDYTVTSSGRKPQYVGKWTNDIVYNRLKPGVLKKLQELNPRTSSGSRRRKHHQYFTEDYGVPELKQHLHTVEALMKACDDWDEFKRILKRALPVQGDQIEMDL